MIVALVFANGAKQSRKEWLIWNAIVVNVAATAHDRFRCGKQPNNKEMEELHVGLYLVLVQAQLLLCVRYVSLFRFHFEPLDGFSTSKSASVHFSQLK